MTRSPQPDRLAVTKALTAIDPDSAELVAARDLGIAVEPWQQVVADAAVGRTLVAVAGTHGKSTVAGWLTHVLAEAGLDPAAFVGALLPASIANGAPATARRGGGAVFVVEADEYAGNFDAFRPDLAAVTNVEWDHPDLFANVADVLETFAAWLARSPDASVVINTTSPGGDRLMARLARTSKAQLLHVLFMGTAALTSRSWRSASSHYGQRSRPRGAVLGRLVSSTGGGTRIEVFGPGFAPHGNTIDLPTAGTHNVENALVVAGVLTTLGVAVPAIVRGLESFPGIGRRLERKGEAAGVVVYDDYGHHPTAIRATIAATRQREPGKRIWAVYEPLTFHRTAAMLDEFAEALAEADGVAVADIWAGRDRDTSIASSGGLAAAVRVRAPDLVAEAPGDVETTAAWLAERVRPGDVVLVMGGGRSYRIGELLLESLDLRERS